MNLAQNIRQIKENINKNKISDVTFIAVTKTVDVSVMKSLLGLGLNNFAENRVQVLENKYQELKNESNITWHFIGHLQSKKVKKVVPIVDYIHSVDSIKLARIIDSVALKCNKKQKVLIEVNVSGEEVKYGFNPEETLESFDILRKLENIDIIGLMTMAPYLASSEELDRIFSGLSDLKEKINIRYPQQTLTELSMGMSMDYINALKNGATMVRIGSAIFE